MIDKIEPSTHIDVLVVKNLLISRLNEGKELLKSATVSTNWKKRELAFQEKCKAAIKSIDEGIAIKEGKQYEIPKASGQNSSEGNEGVRKAVVQNQGIKA